MSATFDGPIAGYTTVGVPAETTDKERTAADVTTTSTKETAVPKANAKSQSESLPASLAPSKSVDLDGESTLALAGTPR